VIRDTVYMDGGYLWWTPGMADGSYGTPRHDGQYIFHGAMRSALIICRKPAGPCLYSQLQHAFQHIIKLQPDIQDHF